MSSIILHGEWQTCRKRTQQWARRIAVGTALLAGTVAQAGFDNGDFEIGDLDGWKREAWTNSGTTTSIPGSLADLQLGDANGKQPLVSPVNGAQGSAQDLLWSSGNSDLKLPLRGRKSARINLTDTRASGYSVPPSFNVQPFTATSLSQEVTLTANDIDTDGKIHIRFTAAPVLNDPGSGGHGPADRPYYAIVLTKTFDAQTNSAVNTEIFFQYRYARQPGVNWKSFRDSRNNTHLFTDPQAYDVAPGNHVLRVGDKVKLKAIAAGCSASAHSGHLYLDDVTTIASSGVWLSATGPVSATRDDSTEITYTYTYKNNGNMPVSNVVVTPAMPKDSTGASTSFVSLVEPNGYNYCAGPATGVGSTDAAQCTVPSLAPGETLTFQMTVKVPAGTPGVHINNGDYTIRGDGVTTLTGALIQTVLLDDATSSDMAVDPSGLPANGSVGVAYPPAASFSCTNLGAAAATNAICEATGLPAGIVVGQCQMNGADWAQGDTVPAGSIVVCPVSGTPTVPGSANVQVSTNADNDTVPGNNRAPAPVDITSSDMTVDLVGLPSSGTVGVPYPPTASFSCSNMGAAAAINASCSATGLPAGVAVGQCQVNGADWAQGDTVPAGASVVCPVSGTPTTPGASTVQITTNADNDTVPGNNQMQAPVDIAEPVLVPVDPAGIPTLSEWGLILMSGLLGLMGWGAVRHRRRSGL